MNPEKDLPDDVLAAIHLGPPGTIPVALAAAIIKHDDMMFWPAGWQWQPNQPEYEQMILGVYATLGVFLIMASRNPTEHRSLILFTAWSSLVHAGIMAVQAIRDTAERGHLLGDVPVLALVGIILLVLAPKEAE